MEYSANNAESIKAKCDELVEELKKVIVGKDDILKKVIMVILAGGHILLEDVPGVGKTTLVIGISKAMALEYKRMQFTPDTMAGDIMGFSVYNRESGELEYKAGAALCNLFLADEINRTSAKTQAALLEVMQEGGMTVDGITHKVPQPFICIATQNPLGSAGTQKLPDSQLDRFMVRLSMGYPDIMSQVEIVKQREIRNPIDDVKSVIAAKEILALREEVQKVKATDDVIKYAAELCEETRRHESIEQGAGPRAVIALVQMAKAKAITEGRNYVIPNDISSLFVDVCAHRIILTARAKISKTKEADVCEKVLELVQPPLIAEQK